MGEQVFAAECILSKRLRKVGPPRSPAPPPPPLPPLTRVSLPLSAGQAGVPGQVAGLVLQVSGSSARGAGFRRPAAFVRAAPLLLFTNNAARPSPSPRGAAPPSRRAAPPSPPAPPSTSTDRALPRRATGAARAARGSPRGAAAWPPPACPARASAAGRGLRANAAGMLLARPSLPRPSPSVLGFPLPGHPRPSAAVPVPGHPFPLRPRPSTAIPFPALSPWEARRRAPGPRPRAAPGPGCPRMNSPGPAGTGGAGGSIDLPLSPSAHLLFQAQQLGTRGEHP